MGPKLLSGNNEAVNSWATLRITLVQRSCVRLWKGLGWHLATLHLKRFSLNFTFFTCFTPTGREDETRCPGYLRFCVPDPLTFNLPSPYLPLPVSYPFLFIPVSTLPSKVAQDHSQQIQDSSSHFSHLHQW